MTGYVKAEEMALRWGVSVRQVQMLCQNGKIQSASKFGNAWAIPENTPKPTRTARVKPGRKTKNAQAMSQVKETTHENRKTD